MLLFNKLAIIYYFTKVNFDFLHFVRFNFLPL